MEGFRLLVGNEEILAAGTGMEVFYSYRNRMEVFWLPAQKWSGSSYRNRMKGLYLPELNGGILAAGHLCLCALTVSI
jgi:hypothetical protein